MRKATYTIGYALLNSNRLTKNSYTPQTKTLKYRRKEVRDCARTTPPVDNFATSLGGLLSSSASVDFLEVA
jgi:hypothetical protein